MSNYQAGIQKIAKSILDPNGQIQHPPNIPVYSLYQIPPALKISCKSRTAFSVMMVTMKDNIYQDRWALSFCQIMIHTSHPYHKWEHHWVKMLENNE